MKKRKSIRSGKGSISLFMLIIFVVILAVITSMAEGARIKTARANVAGAGEMTKQNVEASYCKELFEDYGVLFYYGEKEQLQQFLQESVNGNLRQNGIFQTDLQSLEITDMNTAVENNGDSFRKQVIQYMKADIPKEMITTLLERFHQTKESKTESFEEQAAETEQDQKELKTAAKSVNQSISEVMKKNKSKKIRKSAKKFQTGMQKVIQKALDAIGEYERIASAYGKIEEEDEYILKDKRILEQSDQALAQMDITKKEIEPGKKYQIDQLVLPETEKPKGESVIDYMKNLIAHGKLALVVEDPEKISEAEKTGELPSDNYEKKTEKVKWEEKALYSEYCRLHLGSYTNPKDGQLLYEKEYVIAGRDKDEENLEEVVEKLILLRQGCNLAGILMDSEKRKECQIMAVSLAGWTGLPILVALTKGMVMSAWALGESVLDVKTLLGGGKIPLKKTKEDWQCDLDSLFSVNKDTKVDKEKKGLGYEEYLQLLMMNENAYETNLRTMDIIQMNLAKNYASDFQFANCISHGEYHCDYQLRPLFFQKAFSYKFEDCLSF